MPRPDPWTAFLDWLGTLLVPDWNGLMGLMPILLFLGLIGPILTLLLLMWAWHLAHRRRGRVRRTEPAPVPMPAAPDGRPAFPSNIPYCEEHELIYPARARRCQVDGALLRVSCPVDGTVRPAEVQTCPACGTRYVLGAGTAAVLVEGSRRPPEGGATAA